MISENPNTFRFVVIDKETLAQQSTSVEDENSPLLSLPHFLLKKIASFLPISDLIETLLLTNANLADYLLGKVPWKKLKFDATLDSHRACKMVIPSALEELIFGDLWNEETKEEVWGRWRTVLEQAKNLERLVLADVGVFKDVDVKILVSSHLSIHYSDIFQKILNMFKVRH